MKFPSKVTPYKESIIAKFPMVLEKLEKKDMAPGTIVGFRPGQIISREDAAAENGKVEENQSNAKSAVAGEKGLQLFRNALASFSHIIFKLFSFFLRAKEKRKEASGIIRKTENQI